MDATAFSHRDAAYSVGIWAGWSDPERDDELIEWTRELQAAMTSSANGRVYTNYLDQDESVRMRAAYRDNYDRLVDFKTEWGPANVFGLDIEPEA